MSLGDKVTRLHAAAEAVLKTGWGEVDEAGDMVDPTQAAEAIAEWGAIKGVVTFTWPQLFQYQIRKQSAEWEEIESIGAQCSGAAYL
jgi:hypothetical protein